MKKNIIYRAGLAILSLGMLLASCTREELVPDRGNNGGPLSDREMQFSFRFKYGDADKTRALSTDPGENHERDINSVRVVLYDGDNQINQGGVTLPNPDAEVLYSFDFYIQSTNDFNGFEEWPGDWPSNLEYEKGKYLYRSVNKDEFITWARKVEDRNYYMLVILNAYMEKFPTTEVRSPGGLSSQILEMTTVGKKLSDFTQPVSLDREDMDKEKNGGPAAGGYFLMTNANGLVYVPNTDLSYSEQEAHENPIATDVDRAVARVSVTLDADLNNHLPTDVEIGAVSWDLVNTNKHFYWMRKQTNVITASGTPGQHESLVLPVDREFIYAEDPNFSGLLSASSLELQEQFNTVDDVFNSVTPIMFSNSADENRYLYALENTMTADEQVPKLTTQTVLAIPYKPDASYTFENFNTRLNEGYYSFNDIRISMAEMRGYAGTTSTIPPQLTGLEDAITAVNTKFGLDLSTAFDEDRTEPFEESGLKYYRYGINYYSVLIKHYNPNPWNDGYGRYGIVRNNTYNVNITEIAGPGSPILSHPTYISAEVEILPWLENKQSEGNLGEEIETPPITRPSIVTYRYLYETYGTYTEIIPTRAPWDQLAYGFYPVEYKSDYVQMQVGEDIPYPTEEILNKYWNELPKDYNEVYEKGIIWRNPESWVVQEDYNMNIIQIIYLQKRAEVNIYYLDEDDTDHDFWGGYKTLALPNGMVVNSNTPGVRNDERNPDYVYQFYRYDGETGINYVYDYSRYDGGVITDVDEPKEMRLYYKGRPEL